MAVACSKEIPERKIAQEIVAKSLLLVKLLVDEERLNLSDQSTIFVIN